MSNHSFEPSKSSSFKSRAVKLLLGVAVSWYLIAFVKTVYDYYLLKNNSGEDFEFFNWLLGSWVAVTVVVLLLGPYIIYTIYRALRAAPYWKVLLNLTFSYTLITLVAAFIAMPIIYGLDQDVTIYGSESLQYAFNYIQTPNYLAIYFFWLLIVGFTVIALLVNEKYGPGMFGKLLMGQYFHPKQEQRVFMFLDMRSSTAIAEQLGESAYFNFLKDCFANMTTPILDNAGEIYQYVGDEIIVCWPLEKGLEEGRCVKTFFAIKEALNKGSQYYEKTYGVQPVFKAGFHFGQVMAGEIGVIKRDITYSGDVLNTTARIQAKCNELGVDHLISGSLWAQIQQYFPSGAEHVSGQVELRGRQERVDLYVTNERKE